MDVLFNFGETSTSFWHSVACLLVQREPGLHIHVAINPTETQELAGRWAQLHYHSSCGRRSGVTSIRVGQISPHSERWVSSVSTV